MDPITTVLVLMLAVAVCALIASRVGIPYPTMMVVGGLIICFLPQLRAVVIEPRLILTLFLPPLLYGAAWQTSWKDFRANIRPISLMAVGLVLLTTAGVALLVMKMIPGFTWASAFALGAIVSPPDAVAVTAMTKSIRLPRRVVILLEGESLVNDASALVALRFAVAAVMTGTFSIWLAAGQFVVVSAGGVLLGLVIGWLIAEVHRRIIHEPLVDTAITFLTPYATFLLGEQIGVSGVLATVTAGLLVSWRAPEVMKPQTRLQATAVWEFVLFILNGFIFILVGLELPTVLHDLPNFSIAQLIGYGVLLLSLLIAMRIAWVIPGAYLPRIFSKGIRLTEKAPAFKQVLLVGWIGMRGVVSLAVALAIPMTVADGSPFPARGIIIFLTFFVILVTLVAQSLTLPMVVRLLRVQTFEDQLAEEKEARLHAARVALTFLKDLTESTDAFGDLGTSLRAEYELRITRLETGPAVLPISQIGIDTSCMNLQREVLSAERQAVVDLRATQKIANETFQRLMAEIDAEELRIPSMK